MSEEKKRDTWTPPSVEESVAMLKSGPEGVKKWNAMCMEHPEWQPNLSEQDFLDADLSGAYLTGANLEKANLSGVNFFEADLYRANFSGADLSEANLEEANLYGADLSGVNLSRADLSDANLSEANLSKANLSGANFTRTITEATNWWCANIAGTKGLRSSTVELVLATLRDSLVQE